MLSSASLLLCDQVRSAAAQDRAPSGSGLGRALPAVREWEREGRGHGDGGGLPSDGASAADPADVGGVQAEQESAAGSEETHEGGNRERPEEGDPQRSHGQDAAHFCPKNT